MGDVDLRVPHEQDRAVWGALRARLGIEHPWLVDALYRATPVIVEPAETTLRSVGSPDRDSGVTSGEWTVGSDAWGRIYLPVASVQPASSATVQRLAPLVRDALLAWLSASAPRRSWHAERTDPTFPAVARAETSRAAHAAAAGINDSRAGYADPLAQWREWAAALAGPAQVSWQDALGAHLRAAVATENGHQHRTFSRPSRRSMPGVVTPSWRAPMLELAVIVDISGSVHDMLGHILRELAGIADACGLAAERANVYAVDDEVASVQPLTETEQLASRTGHLTDLRPGFAAAARQPRPPRVLVVITDGVTPWPDAAPDGHVIVALTGPGTVREQARLTTPTWADVIDVDTT